jgi:hypothetical protein
MGFLGNELLSKRGVWVEFLTCTAHRSIPPPQRFSCKNGLRFSRTLSLSLSLSLSLWRWKRWERKKKGEKFCNGYIDLYIYKKQNTKTERERERGRETDENERNREYAYFNRIV